MYCDKGKYLTEKKKIHCVKYCTKESFHRENAAILNGHSV